MDRRLFLTSACTTASVTITGCLGSDTEPDEPADSNAERNADLDDETIALANTMGELLEEDLSFRDWRFFDDLFIPEFITENGPADEIPILGRAFATIVQDGFQYESMPTAFNDGGTIDWMVYIQPEWARDYANDEISAESYFEQIRATLH